VLAGNLLGAYFGATIICQALTNMLRVTACVCGTGGMLDAQKIGTRSRHQASLLSRLQVRITVPKSESKFTWTAIETRMSFWVESKAKFLIAFQKSPIQGVDGKSLLHGLFNRPFFITVLSSNRTWAKSWGEIGRHYSSTLSSV
jgi:hypothetical protein